MCGQAGSTVRRTCSWHVPSPLTPQRLARVSVLARHSLQLLRCRSLPAGTRTSQATVPTTRAIAALATTACTTHRHCRQYACRKIEPPVLSLWRALTAGGRQRRYRTWPPLHKPKLQSHFVMIQPTCCPAHKMRSESVSGPKQGEGCITWGPECSPKRVAGALLLLLLACCPERA